MATKRLDVVIIGGGNTGKAATEPIRKASLSVALLEPSLLGGTCSTAAARRRRFWSRRLMPSIKSRRPAPTRSRWPGRGSTGGADRPRNGTDQRSGAKSERFLADRGVTPIRSHGRFVGPNAVAAGDDILEARHIVVATNGASLTDAPSRPRSVRRATARTGAGRNDERKRIASAHFFFAAVFLAGTFLAGALRAVVVFLAAVVLRTVEALVFAATFFAAGFLAAVVLRAAGFFAAVVFRAAVVLRAAGFFAAVVFFAAGFLAGAFFAAGLRVAVFAKVVLL